MAKAFIMETLITLNLILILAAHYIGNIICQYIDSGDKEWYIELCAGISLICLFVGVGFCVISICEQLKGVL